MFGGLGRSQMTAATPQAAGYTVSLSAAHIKPYALMQQTCPIGDDNLKIKRGSCI